MSTAPLTKINLSWLLPFTSALAVIPEVGPWLAGLADGAIVAFDALPGPVQDGLIALFALIGVQVVKGIGVTIFNDLTHHSGSGSGAGTVPAGFMRAWVANGIQFYRNASGMLGVLNKRGRWKQWRPRHPIVIYSNGAHSIKSMLRAEKAMKKQAKEIETMLKRHGYLVSGHREAPEKKIAVKDAELMIAAASRR